MMFVLRAHYTEERPDRLTCWVNHLNFDVKVGSTVDAMNEATTKIDQLKIPVPESVRRLAVKMITTVHFSVWLCGASEVNWRVEVDHAESD